MKSHSFLQTVQYQQEYLAERCQLETQHHSLQKRLKAHGRTICLRPLFSQKCSRNNPIFLVETTNFLHVLAVNYKVLSLAYQAQNQVIHQCVFCACIFLSSRITGNSESGTYL